MATTSEKQQAHELIERLPENEILTVVRFLQFMLLHPVARAAASARMDDEPITAQDRDRLQAGKDQLTRHGHGVTMEDVLAEFGLSPEDFPAHQ